MNASRRPPQGPPPRASRPRSRPAAVLRLGAFAAALLSVGAAGAQPIGVRPLKMHASLNDAIRDAIGQSAAPARSTFFSLAIWEDPAWGRGSAYVAFRRGNPEYGECLELVVSYYKLDPQPRYGDFERAMCRKNPGDDYEHRPQVAVPVLEQRRNRARSFLPPASVRAGQTWTIANTEALVAQSATAAIAIGLNEKSASLPVTKFWESPENRGAMHVYPSSGGNCLKVYSRREIPPPGPDYYAAEYCRTPGAGEKGAGWARTANDAPPRDEMAAVEQEVRKALARAAQDKTWIGVTDGSVAISVAQAPPAPEIRVGVAPPTVRGEPAIKPAPSVPAPSSSDSARIVRGTPAPVVPPRAGNPPEQVRQARNQSLATIPQIKVSELCTPPPEPAPWGGTPAPEGPVPKAAEYRDAVSHALRVLKTLYGQLTPEQSAAVDRLWAPFFDHPTAAAMAWFQQLNPLVDDYLATLSEMDSIFPSYREAVSDVLIASAMASQNFLAANAPKAQVLAARLEEDNRKLEQLAQRIAALGDAPSPLATKCAAQARHRRALSTGADVWALLRQSRFVLATSGQKSRNPNNDFSTAGDAGVNATFTGAPGEATRAAKVARETPASSLQWNGARFTYASKTRHFDAPCTREGLEGVGSQYSSSLEGELSPDGTSILRLTGSTTERYCESDKGGAQVREARDDIEIPRAVAQLHGGKPTHAEPARIEVVYTRPGMVLPADLSTWKPRPGDVLVRFANSLMIGSMNMCNALSIGSYASVLGTSADPRGADRARQVEEKTRRECDARYAAWLAGRDYAAAAPAPSVASAPSQAGPGQPASASQKALDEARAKEEAQANREALEHHQAIAAQMQRNADRWAEDARNEKDKDRREWMERQALAHSANAQAERDLAESLRTGTLVKTRTEYDQRQSDANVAAIRREVEQFAAEDARLDRINKYLLADHGFSSGDVTQRVSQALKSPNREQALARLEEEVYAKVRSRKAEELESLERGRELAEFELNRPIEVAKMTVNAAVTLTAMAVPGAGPLAIGYGLGMGYVEGGPAGLAKAGLSMYSPYLDVTIATLEGAYREGAWGALKGAGTAAFMNKAMTVIGPRLQSAMSNRIPDVPVIPASRRPPVEVEIHTAERRYELAKAAARTPEQAKAVRQAYETVEQRHAMKQERAQAEARADEIASKARKPDGTVDTSHPEYKRAMDGLKRDLGQIDQKYAAGENRDLLHGEAIQAAGLAENQIKLSGGKPKTPMSDMDVSASSYDAGKKYVGALTKKGLSAVEYGDRWVLSNDTTVWKPTASAKAGSSAFEAETAFGASRGSDKFATASGQSITKGEASGDRLGGVIDNIKKAGEAGLGTQGEKDLHVIGKSADKAVDIAGTPVDKGFREQLAGLRNHQPASAVGITTLGASPAVKARQIQQFNARAQAELSNAFKAAQKQSIDYQNSLTAARDAARARGDMKEVGRIQNELATVRSSNRVAQAGVADIAPGVVTDPGGTAARPAAGWIPVSILLDRERQAGGKLEAPPRPGAGAALGDLGERCREGARRLGDRLAAARPGSDEARYLAALKGALERGAANPADAVHEVRSLSGFELALVLNQLSVPSKK